MWPREQRECVTSSPAPGGLGGSNLLDPLFDVAFQRIREIGYQFDVALCVRCSASVVTV